MFVLPNFFIAGAARSGTTSMWRYLQQHPDIFMPDDIFSKEPSFFCEYRNHFGIEDRNEYLKLFAGAGSRRMIGEASGPYLTSPESPGLIQREIPNARFVIMLRNPADRAYSLYKWMHQYGFEKLPSFQGALGAEKVRFDNEHFKKNNGQYYYNFLYFLSGLYHDQVKRFFDTFGRSQVHVIIFEEFKQDALNMVRQTYAFLGVDPSFMPKIEIHNPGSPEYGDLNRALRQALLERYSDSIAQLGQLLRRDLGSVWR